ncbi:MAG: serine/threonine-protein kinase [Candidatus Wallbacteria bacterium]|nr:serine/threonine-protein kinase [Candidatus Wallbacteria bacterium]
MERQLNMEGRYLSQIKIHLIERVVAESSGNEALLRLTEKLFDFFAEEAMYLSRLIQALSRVEVDFNERIRALSGSRHPAVRRACIDYFTARRDGSFKDEYIVSFPEEPLEIKLALCDYFYFFFTEREIGLLINFLRREKEPRLRARIIRIIGRFSGNREVIKFLQALRPTLADEREWIEYVEILGRLGDWRVLMQLGQGLPVMVRIAVYSTLDGIRDFKTREFIWDKFRKEEEIVRIALLKTLRIDSETDAIELAESVENFNPILQRKIVGILAVRESGDVLVDFIRGRVLDETVKLLVSIVRSLGDEQLLKLTIRMLRSSGLSGDDRNRFNKLLAEQSLSEQETAFLLYFLDHQVEEINISLLSTLERAALPSDLDGYSLSRSFQLWLGYLMLKKSVPQTVIFPFQHLFDGKLKNEIVFYCASSGDERCLPCLFEIIKSVDIDGPQAVRLIGPFLDEKVKKQLIYNFKSFTSRTKVAVLELFKQDIAQLMPLLRSMLGDENREARLKGIELLRYLPQDMVAREFLDPLMAGDDPELILSLMRVALPPDHPGSRDYLRFLCRVDGARTRLHVWPGIFKLYEEFPLAHFLFAGFDDSIISQAAADFLHREWQDEKKSSLLFTLFNNLLFPGDVETFSQGLIFVTAAFILENSGIDETRGFLSSSVNGEFPDKLRLELDWAEQRTSRAVCLDLLKGVLKQEYPLQFYGREYRVSHSRPLRELIDGYPANREGVLSRLGESYFMENDFQQTVFYLNQTSVEGEHRQKYTLILGCAYIRLGHFSVGIPLLEKIDLRSAAPEMIELYYLSANELEKRNEWRKALQFYKNLADIDIRFRDVNDRIARAEARILSLQGRQFPFDTSRFTQVEEIGSGGMGKVFRAYDVSNGCTVAIKVLADKHTDNLQVVRRFITRDGLILQKLDHPCIVKVFEVIREGTSPYIVMEYIEGGSLHTLIREAGPLPDEKTRIIFRSILGAMTYAHEQGIIHRDLKPENIMVNHKDSVKIMDFGLAKEMGATTMTQAGETFGTLYYMPPEQVRGSEVDTRADIYALGVILYEMLSGTVPFCGENPEATMYKIFKENPSPLGGIDSKLEKWDSILQRALEKKPQDRFASVIDFLDDFEKVV